MSGRGIEVHSNETRQFPPRERFSMNAHIKSFKEYERLYKWSVEDPEDFWAEMAGQNLVWYRKWDRVLDYDFGKKPYVKWFEGGRLNASYNCLDRFVQAPGFRNKAALIWEADDGSYKTYTYQQLYREVNRFANVLLKKGFFPKS